MKDYNGKTYKVGDLAVDVAGYLWEIIKRDGSLFAKPLSLNTQKYGIQLLERFNKNFVILRRNGNEVDDNIINSTQNIYSLCRN